MAVGKSGAARRPRPAEIRFGDILVAEKGWVAPGYREEDRRRLHEARSWRSRSISASARPATVWTCDLTHAYVDDQRGLPLMKLVLVAAVALVDRDGRVLLAQRPEGKSMAGCGSFPAARSRRTRRPRPRASDPRIGRGAWDQTPGRHASRR
jgi:hypothetical protein